MNLDQQYWDRSYDNFRFYEEEDTLTEWLCHYYFKDKELSGKTILEIGCFPGRYLIHFGKRGMKLNGLDLTPHLIRLPDWLAERNVKYGEFYQTDVLNFDSKNKFDVVCSFGFIEHFTNFQEIIEKHIELNSINGTIIITTPNFRGFQFLLHRLFDGANLQRHNTKAMNPDKWAALLEKAGYEIIYKGYFGKYAFWYDSELSERMTHYREKYMKHIHWRLLRWVNFDSWLLSPYCGIIAAKPQQL